MPVLQQGVYHPLTIALLTTEAYMLYMRPTSHVLVVIGEAQDVALVCGIHRHLVHCSSTRVSIAFAWQALQLDSRLASNGGQWPVTVAKCIA